jgi:Arc/MetJ-type ribon-helix-helix transcriptional regulator
VTIQLPQDLASLVEDAVRTGQYECQDDVIRDALIRLRQAMEAEAASTDETGERAQERKPLTKQRLKRHLEEIGLVDQVPAMGSASESASSLLSDDEDEIISEAVIRERLIESLTGFLN